MNFVHREKSIRLGNQEAGVIIGNSSISQLYNNVCDKKGNKDGGSKQSAGSLKGCK